MDWMEDKMNKMMRLLLLYCRDNTAILCHRLARLRNNIDRQIRYSTYQHTQK